jgi:hypothetical protein
MVLMKIVMLQIEKITTPPSFALFELGFRPFFSAAGFFAVVAILLWMMQLRLFLTPFDQRADTYILACPRNDLWCGSLSHRYFGCSALAVS